LIFITIFEWVRAQDKNSLQLAWAASLTLAVTPLLGFRFEFQDLPVLLIPTTLILAVVGERWTQTGNWSVIGFMVTFLSLSWVASDDIFNILQTALDHQMFLFFPIMVIFGLYWVRWWALRPPRTWLDQITRTGV